MSENRKCIHGIGTWKQEYKYTYFVATNINYAKLIIVDVMEVAKVDSYIWLYVCIKHQEYANNNKKENFLSLRIFNGIIHKCFQKLTIKIRKKIYNKGNIKM